MEIMILYFVFAFIVGGFVFIFCKLHKRVRRLESLFEMHDNNICNLISEVVRLCGVVNIEKEEEEY